MWRKLIEDLQAYGVTLEDIAGELGISVRMVCYYKEDPDCEPKHSVGEKLKALHARCVPRETAQQIS